jgi:NADH-quinone oxidoreductase subunit K
MPIESLQVGLNHYLFLSAMMFTLGMLGVLFRRNVLVILMSIELMLNAVNLTFIAFSRYLGNVNGQILVFFVMTVAAAEAAVGLALAVTVLKKYREVNIRFFERLKG